MLDQLTVFIENKPGRLVSLCRILGEANISMSALMVADTTEFGVIRIVCDSPNKALDLLRSKGYSAALTPVLAVEVPDTPGGLAEVLDLLDQRNINIEYAYCFQNSKGDFAIDVLKIESGQQDNAIDAFKQAGVRLLTSDEVVAHPGA